MHNLKEGNEGPKKFIPPKTQEEYSLLYRQLKAYGRKKLFHQYPALELYIPDLFHEAMFDLIMELSKGSYQERASIESYFGRIFLNKCQKMKNKLHPAEEFEEVSHSPLYGVARLPEDRRQAVLDCIERLPDGEKEVIILHYYKEYSNEIIALRTELDMQTIKNRASKAYKKLLPCILNSPAFKD